MLHGYADGHGLLESSMRLSDSGHRTMLRLSDLSGPGRESGFDQYLTLYPIEADGLYVVARTWYADEMRRPGCVWTHSLLVRSEDLRLIPSLAPVLRLHRRPDGQAWSDQYRDVLTIEERAELRVEPGSWNYPLGLVANVMRALYDGSEAPVIIAADASEAYEELVTSVWSTQWPELRAVVRFCTGSLSNRTSNDDQFDLQVVPRGRVARIRKQLENCRFVDEFAPSAKQLSPEDKLQDWTWRAAAEVSRPTAGSLMGFLWDFGGDAPRRRKTLGDLSSIHETLERAALLEKPVEKLAGQLGKAFPRPEDARALKASIFGPTKGESRSELLSGVGESERLHALATMRQHKALLAGDCKVRERARALWASDAEGAWEVVEDVAKGKVTPFGKAFLRGVGDAIWPEAFAERYRSSRSAAIGLFTASPKLAGASSLWQLPDELQEELLEALQRQRLTKRTLNQIAVGMVQSDSIRLPYHALSAIGPRLVSAAMDALQEATREPETRRNWLDAVIDYPSELLTWLGGCKAPDPSLVAQVIHYLDKTQWQIEERGARFWIPLVEGLSELKTPTSRDALAYLLSMGLRNIGDHPEELVAATFSAVHDAVSKDKLARQAWRKLEAVLSPESIRFFIAGSRTRRLRAGLVAKFEEYGWPTEQFVLCFRDAETLERVLRSVRYSPLEGRLRRRLRSLSANNLVRATPEVARLVRSI